MGTRRRRTMSTSHNAGPQYHKTYAEALDTLNSLQTPYQTIEANRKAGVVPNEMSNQHMRTYLQRIGYTDNDLTRLNIIHVAGTKGKGSTCAYVDSILQRCQDPRSTSPRGLGENGSSGSGDKKTLKVGLLTSPHLVTVRERIRINSVPLPEALFTRYFFEVYDKLKQAASSFNCSSNSLSPQAYAGLACERMTDAQAARPQPSPPTFPVYARFLTLLSYHVFLCEGTDICVYETGVGGAFDSTNVVRHPVATGISTLAIDHTAVLGTTLPQIAWHKAGIMKRGAPAFTVPQHPEALDVLRQRASEIGVRLQVVHRDAALQNVAIRPVAGFEGVNASLAIRLVDAAMEFLREPVGGDAGRWEELNCQRADATAEETEKELPVCKSLPCRHLPQPFIDGLERVVWRGRCEIKPDKHHNSYSGSRVTWHLDGAHTTDSLRMATRWFRTERDRASGSLPVTMLIFNQQGREEAAQFLDGMFEEMAAGRGDDMESNTARAFDCVVFCSNVTAAATGYKRDFVNNQLDPAVISKLTVQRQFAEKWRSLDPHARVIVLPTIEEAIDFARKFKVPARSQGMDAETETETETEKEITRSRPAEQCHRSVSVLITGSFHLVGGAMSILDESDEC